MHSCFARFYYGLLSDVCVQMVRRVFPKTRVPRVRLINRRRTTMTGRVSGNKIGRLPGKETRYVEGLQRYWG